MRAYLRQRERLLDYAASHIQHMQKALMQMNLQLHHVVTDITGATGMAIIRAIVAGERDPAVLAANRDPRCYASLETISQALVGNDREEHIFALTQASIPILAFCNTCSRWGAASRTDSSRATSTISGCGPRPILWRSSCSTRLQCHGPGRRMRVPAGAKAGGDRPSRP